MNYYRECSKCGAHLDPGEMCDCEKENAAPVLEHRDGKAEQNEPRSASIVHEN